MRTSILSTSLWIALLTAGLMACDGDAEMTANILPWVDAGAAVEPDTGDTTGGTGGVCDCFTEGMWFHFDSMVLETIGGGDHPVIGTLNTLWAADISKSELNILFEVTSVTATNIEFRAMNAARITDTASDLCLLPNTEATFAMAREGCSFSESAESSINIYAGSVDNPKNCSTVLPVPHAIPVDRAVLSGEFSPTCDAITSGVVVSGALEETALDQVCACLLLGDEMAETCGELDPNYEGDCPGCNDGYQPLGTLLNAFGPVAFDCESASGAPAACITASFTASRWDTPLENCE
jgi:hypothetical protein